MVNPCESRQRGDQSPPLVLSQPNGSVTSVAWKPNKQKQLTPIILELTKSKETSPRQQCRGFSLLTQHGGGALTGIGWSLDSDQQHRDCAALCRLFGRYERTLPRALTVSAPSTPDGSLTSVSGSQRNACSPRPNGLKSICSFLFPQIHQPFGLLRIS